MFFGAIGEFALGEFLRPEAIVPPVPTPTRMLPTHERYRKLGRLNKNNWIIEDDIPLEDALALWWSLEDEAVL